MAESIESLFMKNVVTYNKSWSYNMKGIIIIKVSSSYNFTWCSFMDE